MTQVARVLDAAQAEARARILDVIALLGVSLIGAALLFEMYTIGFTAADAAATGGDAVFVRDQRFVRMLVEMAVVSLSVGWIAFRLFGSSVRRSGG